jgi:hypothetical protein
MAYKKSNANGQATMANSEPVVIASDQSAIPVSVASVPSHAVTNAGTFAVQESGAALTALQLIDDTVYTDGSGTVTKGIAILGQDGTNPQAIKTDANGELQVDVLTMPSVTVTATDLDVRNLVFATDKVDASGTTLGANSGVDIGDVTINNASIAVTQSGTWDEVGINDSGNSITVDAPVGTPVFVRLSDGAAAITTLPVSLASVPSHQVTNAGTFAVQSTNQANSGVDIGDVTINNAAGASAVNIQDGGNSITIDGAVTNTTLSVVGGGTEATAQRVTIANDSTGVLSVDDNGGSLTVDGTVTANLAAGTNNIGDVDVLTINGVAPAFNTGVRGATVQRVTIATDDIVPASQSGTWTVQPGNTANSTPWLVTPSPATSGGLSKFHLVSAASTNATNVKASAGQVYAITVFNVNASPRYLKFHNTAGTPTAGTSVTESFLIPGNTSGAGMVINFDKGIAFSTGIGITTVTEMADSGTTGVGANEILINIYYK